ncbi:LPS translocon maturation chaperone LptM [Thermomonas paludicola]|uniref:LPS translocon maturation chaperone LptM n=1 Tax=Thermomonas paludicola TaxID=2884874 RepID=UPI00211399A2|nr:lipoprotein [Thermomonas paludicola]
MTKRIAFLSLLLCLLTACGNKGPLVLPDAPPADAPAASQPAAADAPAKQD